MILNFININRYSFLYTILFLGFIFNANCDEFHKISNDKNDEYEVVFYNRQNKIIAIEKYPKPPVINRENKNVYRIYLSLGTYNSYTSFYFIDENCFSNSLYNVIAYNIEYNLIAFENDLNTISVENIFGHEVDFKIKRDFVDTATVVSAVIGITFIDKKTLEIEYYTGKDYRIKKEIIEIEFKRK